LAALYAFRGATVLEIGCDPRRSDGVGAEFGGDARGGRSSHRRSLAAHGAGELARAAPDRAEQRPLGIAAQAGAVEIADEVFRPSRAAADADGSDKRRQSGRADRDELVHAAWPCGCRHSVILNLKNLSDSL